MRAHEDRVFAICLRILTNRDAALDAVQETFITVYRKAQQFCGCFGFQHLVVPDCRQHLLRPTTSQPNATRRSLFAETGDPADDRSQDLLGSVELRPDLEHALASLAPEFRVAVVLSDLEGLPSRRSRRRLMSPSERSNRGSSAAGGFSLNISGTFRVPQFIKEVNMTHEHDFDLIAAIAEGGLGPARAAAAEALLESCQDCRTDLQLQREALASPSLGSDR